MLLLYFLAWVIFNGKLTLEIALFGVVISVMVFIFTCAFMDYSLAKEWRLIRKSGRILKVLGVLLIEIFKANYAVMCLIYDPKYEAEPAVVRFKTDLKSEYARVVLADCITMTPGTITGELEGDTYTVHCLDKDFGVGMNESSFVKVLYELEADD